MPTKNKMPTRVEKDDRLYVEKAAKMCAYLVDIENLCIEVPMGEEPDMMALHLKNTRGFQIRYVLPDAPKPISQKFEPAPFSHKPTVKVDVSTVPNFKPIERFKTREGWLLNLVAIKSNGELEFAWLDSMKPNFAISKLGAEINIKHKVWVFLGR